MPHYAALLVAGKVTAKVHNYTVIDLVAGEHLPDSDGSGGILRIIEGWNGLTRHGRA
jgi:hypothetical protein